MNLALKERLSLPKTFTELSKKKKIVLCAAFAAVLVALSFFLYNVFSVNKYNKLGYINTSGKTIGQIAEENGISLETLLEEYDLPKNMRADTEEAAAYYTISTEKIASMSGMTFEEMKQMYHWDYSITAQTSWGVAQGETLLKYMYSTETALNSFKEEYNLGDEVTGDTKYKEVRDEVAKSSQSQKQMG